MACSPSRPDRRVQLVCGTAHWSQRDQSCWDVSTLAVAPLVSDPVTWVVDSETEPTDLITRAEPPDRPGPILSRLSCSVTSGRLSRARVSRDWATMAMLLMTRLSR